MHFPRTSGETGVGDMRRATWPAVLLIHGALASSCKDLPLRSPVGTWGDQVTILTLAEDGIVTIEHRSDDYDTREYELIGTWMSESPSYSRRGRGTRSTGKLEIIVDQLTLDGMPVNCFPVRPPLDDDPDLDDDWCMGDVLGGWWTFYRPAPGGELTVQLPCHGGVPLQYPSDATACWLFRGVPI